MAWGINSEGIQDIEVLSGEEEKFEEMDRDTKGTVTKRVTSKTEQEEKRLFEQYDTPKKNRHKNKKTSKAKPMIGRRKPNRAYLDRKYY